MLMSILKHYKEFMIALFLLLVIRNFNKL